MMKNIKLIIISLGILIINATAIQATNGTITNNTSKTLTIKFSHESNDGRLQAVGSQIQVEPSLSTSILNANYIESSYTDTTNSTSTTVLAAYGSIDKTKNYSITCMSLDSINTDPNQTPTNMTCHATQTT